MKYSARDLHNSIASIELGLLDRDTIVSLEKLNNDTKLLLNLKVDYDLDPSLEGRFWEDMAKLEKILSNHWVDIEKEFRKY